MNRLFQRIGARSNSHVGRAFEETAAGFFAEKMSLKNLQRNVEIPVGFDKQKPHRFDLVDHEAKVIIECKSHKWTVGGNVPSAKMTTWNEVMLYFSITSADYRKILFVLRHPRPRNGETLANYYLRTRGHLIPLGVELWEYDKAEQNAVQLTVDVQNNQS